VRRKDFQGARVLGVPQDQRQQAVYDAAERAGTPSRALEEAVNTVLYATGEHHVWYRDYDGYGQAPRTRSSGGATERARPGGSAGS